MDDHPLIAADPAVVELDRAGPTFESFYESHVSALRGALWVITRERHEAEEIAQEAFLRVWERWEQVAMLDDPEGYLYRTAMNVFLSRRRRAAVALRRIVRVPEPDDPFAEVERKEILLQAMASLTGKERAAVVLTTLLGFTSEEAGSYLHISPSTVRVLASRGRSRMAKEASDDNA
jgi:RNA polymerase sigma-70 factor (ECF subfamily)